MDPEDYPELEHAQYSPSSLKYYALCPSWLPGDSEEAGEIAGQRGTAMHKAFETGDLSHCKTEDERILVQKALNYVDYIIRNTSQRMERAQRAARRNS